MITTVGAYRKAYVGQWVENTRRGKGRPVAVVAEGDSWFKGPVTGIVALLDHRLKAPILNLADLGDHLTNVGSPDQYMTSDKQKRRLGRALKRIDYADVLLLSAGGNDLVGEARSYIKPHSNGDDIAKVVDETTLDQLLAEITASYIELAGLARRIRPEIKVFLHQYDRPRLMGKGVTVVKTFGPWYYPIIKEKSGGTATKQFAHNVVAHIIDRFAKAVESLTASDDQFVLVPTLGTLTNDDDWNDELHFSLKGGKKLASKFRQKIQQKLPSLVG